MHFDLVLNPVAFWEAIAQHSVLGLIKELVVLRWDLVIKVI